MERIDNSSDPETNLHDLNESLDADYGKIIALDSWVDEAYDADEEMRYLKNNYPHIYKDFKSREDQYE